MSGFSSSQTIFATYRSLEISSSEDLTIKSPLVASISGSRTSVIADSFAAISTSPLKVTILEILALTPPGKVFIESPTANSPS